MAHEFHISTGSTTPIFRQIADQVRVAVAMGKLKQGDPLPSVRALAEKLLVNPNTIAKAYSDLARDGVIETQQGRGVFVGATRSVYTAAERQRRLEPAVDAMINSALALGYRPDEIEQFVSRRLGKFLERKTAHE